MTRPRRTYLDLAPDDEEAPQPGDVLRGPRVDVEVVEACPTESRVWPHRWTVTVRSLGPHAARPGRRILWFRPYARGETPADVFGIDQGGGA